MTGRFIYSPRAERQLNEINDRITRSASADVAKRFLTASSDRHPPTREPVVLEYIVTACRNAVCQTLVEVGCEVHGAWTRPSR